MMFRALGIMSDCEMNGWEKYLQENPMPMMSGDMRNGSYCINGMPGGFTR